MSEQSFEIRWIFAPEDPDVAGLYGTTTHEGRSPAAAVLAAAHTISQSLPANAGPAQLIILSIAADERPTLLTAEALARAARMSRDEIPFEVVYRRLC